MRLVDIVVTPVSVTFNAQSGGNAPALQAGEVVDALVLRLIDATRAQLSIANTLIEVETRVPLVPGTTVQLAVKTTPEGLKLVLLREGEARPSSAASPGSASSAAAPARGSSSAAAPIAPAEISETAPAPIGPAEALQATVRAAAARQDGLAPLMADVAAAQSLAGLPAPVRQAAARLLALRVPLDGKLGASDLRQAFARSGLLLEARLAAGSPPAAPDGDLKATLLVFRQVLSAWLGEPEAAPVAAPPASAMPAGAPQTPRMPTPSSPSPPSPPSPPSSPSSPSTPSAASAAAVPNAAVPVAGSPAINGAPSLYRAVAQAFAPAEPSLARGAVPADKPVAPPAEEKAAPELSVSAPPPRRPPPPYRGAAPSAQPPAEASIAAPELSVSAPPPRRPPPPYRGAAPSAQPPAEASIAAASPREAAKALLAETDAALARHTLLQAASLPDRVEPGTRHSDPTGPRWAFEVPFATPGGTAIAQFEIARDGHGPSVEEMKPVWRARFSLDVEPIGAVHAQVALVGGRASVTLWAEREDSAARLRAGTSQLADALRAADLDPGEVLVRGGAPSRPAAPAGRFLDRAS